MSSGDTSPFGRQPLGSVPASEGTLKIISDWLGEDVKYSQISGLYLNFDGGYSFYYNGKLMSCPAHNRPKGIEVARVVRGAKQGMAVLHIWPTKGNLAPSM